VDNFTFCKKTLSLFLFFLCATGHAKIREGAYTTPKSSPNKIDLVFSEWTDQVLVSGEAIFDLRGKAVRVGFDEVDLNPLTIQSSSKNDSTFKTYRARSALRFFYDPNDINKRCSEPIELIIKVDETNKIYLQYRMPKEAPVWSNGMCLYTGRLINVRLREPLIATP
jgi:hypothetical protein